jgi:YebC/PmpR family DNA-binding regulatory protein
MSGHSHAKTVMRTKQASDAKRSQIFSKFAKELQVAAREGGGDPAVNPRLRTLIDKAKTANMPFDNIERALKKASGEDAGQLQEILIEAYGPEGIALLIAAITDNKNRTIGEIKQVLQKNQGKMVEGGAVQWLFDRKGVAVIENAEKELELFIIEAGAEDLFWRNNTLDIYTDPAELGQLKSALEEKGLQASVSIDWVPKEHTSVSETAYKALERLLDALDEQDDVQNVYSNL